MFEKGLDFYKYVVSGKNTQALWLFYFLTSLAISVIVFIIFNLDHNDHIDLSYAIIKFNNNRLWLLDSNIISYKENIKYWKIAEFATILSASLVFVYLSHLLLRRSYLHDALSEVRNELFGLWELQLDNYAGGDNSRNLTVKVQIGQTEAKKLDLSFVSESEFQFNSDTPQVALSVSGDGAQRDRIDISFPLRAGVSYNNKSSQIFYFIEIYYIGWRDGSGMFTGSYHSISLPDKSFRYTGTCHMQRQDN